MAAQPESDPAEDHCQVTQMFATGIFEHFSGSKIRTGLMNTELGFGNIIAPSKEYHTPGPGLPLSAYCRLSQTGYPWLMNRQVCYLYSICIFSIINTWKNK